ncbi:FkbM family methyltransferase [Candidatus Puniceispirillum sp.]|nr:FkbM family methyltransferase [Candidatus Puniceispirillum sp.]
MHKFGTFQPSGFSRVILTLAKLGFGRGRIKLLFAQMWGRLHRDRSVDMLYYGLKFRLKPLDNTIDSKIIFSSKRREETELRMISRYLADGGVFVDIGANIGYYSLNAALLGAEKVIAIEPNPTILARLNENIALNNLSSKIAVHDVAVGAKRGVAKLTIADSDFGSSSIVDHSVGTQHISVATLPLFEILKTEAAGMATIIKIDIEGMEDRALFPYFEAINPESYPKLIVMEDGINIHWERDILSWLLANGYNGTKRTRGNVMLTLAR